MSKPRKNHSEKELLLLPLLSHGDKALFWFFCVSSFSQTVVSPSPVPSTINFDWKQWLNSKVFLLSSQSQIERRVQRAIIWLPWACLLSLGKSWMRVKVWDLILYWKEKRSILSLLAFLPIIESIFWVYGVLCFPSCTYARTSFCSLLHSNNLIKIKLRKCELYTKALVPSH